VSSEIKGSYLIVCTLTRTSARYLYNIHYGRFRGNKREVAHPELFPFEISSNKSTSGAIKIMYKCPRSLVVLARLIHLHPKSVIVWEADRISLNDFPKETIEGAELMVVQPRYPNGNFKPKEEILNKFQGRMAEARPCPSLK